MGDEGQVLKTALMAAGENIKGSFEDLKRRVGVFSCVAISLHFSVARWRR